MEPIIESILHHQISYKSLSLKRSIFTSTPPWTFIKPSINLQLTELPKKSTPPITYRDRFQPLNIKRPISVTPTTAPKQITELALPTSLTIIYTQNVIGTPRQSSQQNFSQFTSLQLLVQPTRIVSDSLAALTAITNYSNSDHPLVSRILILLNTFAKKNAPA